MPDRASLRLPGMGEFWVENGLMDAALGTGDAKRWIDRFTFEWPWVRAVLLLLATLAIVMPVWHSTFMWGLISACCAFLCCLAIGLRLERKSLAAALAILMAGAVAGLVLPIVVIQAIWILIAILLGLLLAALRYLFPYRAKLVRVGDKYAIGGTTYEIKNITIKTPRVFYLRQHLLEQLVDLAAYADEFLGRHGIAYVLCYGSLLGVVRHKGPMPWDDDVDFTIYRPQDIQKMEACFAELAAAASEDGYHLFAHNDYWKLSRKGFWRYPVVDMYRAAIYQPIDAVPQRAAWGSLALCVPDNRLSHIVDYYGKDSLTAVVFDIPYWDSGLVPAAVTRLFGTGFANLAGAAYQKVFGNS